MTGLRDWLPGTPGSMRWQLAITYAAIALLTSAALGAILLSTLRYYYDRQEFDYLWGNAKFISTTLADQLSSGAPIEAIESQVEGFAFLAQARVKLFDSEGQVVADSGPPNGAMLQVGKQAPGRLMVILRGRPGEDGDVLYTRALVNVQGPRIVDAVPIARTLFGFVLGATGTPAGTSGKKARLDVPNVPGSTPLGSIELSGGPTYGTEIVNGVARLWGVASTLAVLLAAAIGWVVSRRITRPLLALTALTAEMAAGDLSVRANASGRDEIGALARSFNEMAGRLEEMVSTLRQFGGDAAHEIHTPLTALRTNLDLALDEDDGPRRRAFLERARAQVMRVEELTDHLLDLSRLETAPDSVRLAPLDLVPLVQEVSEVYASQAEQAGLSFELTLPGRAVMVRGDGAQIRRALGNLLSNAIKFSGPGGRIDLKLEADSAWTRLSVQDTGIGIPDEDLPKLFSRFHRARNASAHPGSGLGLAIVKAIMNRHGGRVSVENGSPGARFTLEWPTRQPTEAI